MFTVEWKMPYFDMGSTFNYAEMIALLAPRPFMVERGHWDGVAPDEWVAYEYAKVRWMCDTLGIGDRTEIEFFDGLHEINGKGTFEFLHKHLKWPKPDKGLCRNKFVGRTILSVVSDRIVRPTTLGSKTCTAPCQVRIRQRKHRSVPRWR